MVDIKEMVRISLISVLIAAALASTSNEALNGIYEESYNSFIPPDGRIQFLLETKRSINGIKNLIDELHNKLVKRTACVLDGGLSASCNHKDAVEAGEHHRFLASSFAPGRRKRNPPPINSETFNFHK